MIQEQYTLGKRTWRLALCATAATAALAATHVHAAIISVDFSSNPLSTVPFNIDGLYLNVVTGGATTNNVTGYDINPYFGGAASATPTFMLFLPSTGGVIGVGTAATRLAPGATVNAGATFINGVTSATFATAGTGYFGFRFINEGTGILNYGYLTVSQTLPIAAGAVRVLAYAYENTGAAITIPVPEASTYLMMAFGLAGVAAVARRHRNAA